MIGSLANNELKGIWNEVSWPNLTDYTGICLEGLRKIKQTSLQIARFRAKIWTWNLLNSKQDCYTLDYNVNYFKEYIIKVYYLNFRLWHKTEQAMFYNVTL